MFLFFSHAFILKRKENHLNQSFIKTILCEVEFTVEVFLTLTACNVRPIWSYWLETTESETHCNGLL